MTLSELPVVPQQAMVNIALVETLRGVIGDDFPFLVSTFVEDSAQKIHRLQRLDIHSQQEAIKQIVHSLKGSFCNMGAEQLASLCGSLESELLEMTTFEYATRIIQIDLHRQKLVAQLKEF